MRIALYQPDIPQNTGTILRLGACLGIPVDIIGPAGFDMTDRALRRAGLDYMGKASLTRHASWEHFLAARDTHLPAGRLILASAHAADRHVDFSFETTDTLLLGRESAGVPTSVRAATTASVRIPILDGLRSLNVAVAAAIVLGEALRQTGGFAE